MKNFKKLVYFSLCLFACSLSFFSCRKEVSSNIEASENPVANKLAPDSASENTTLTLTGTGLGSIKSVVFSKGNITAPFNSNFNTGSSLLFRVPADAQNGAQNIIITNNIGIQLSIPFKVLGYPVVTNVSNYNFTTGTEITITGKNLLDVTTVYFEGSTTTGPTIVSQTATTLVVKFPATTVSRTALTITNLTGSLTTTQEFCSYDNNFAFFTDDYQNGKEDASWAGATISSTEYRSGTASFGYRFEKDNYSQMGFGWNDASNNNYQYLTFWMKGGTVDLDFWIFTQQTPGLYECYDLIPNKILVPANVWTYFRLPVSALKLFGNNNSTAFNQIGWRLKGPDNVDQRLYLDDVMLVK